RATPARCSVHCGTWLARRKLFERLGSFNEQLRTDEDLDFHIRLRDRATPRLIIPNVVLHYRWHNRSLMHGAQSVDQTSQLRLLSSRRRRRTTDAARQSRITTSVASRTSPAITAVLVVKDGARHLEQALQSIRQQSRPPDEILCIVGASSDETVSLLGRQPGLRVMAQRDAGLAAARNQAIAEAKGSHIAFLDHDDIWLPDKLQLQIDALAFLQGPGVSVTNVEFFEDSESERHSLRSRVPVRLGTTP